MTLTSVPALGMRVAEAVPGKVKPNHATLPYLAATNKIR